MKIKLKSLTLVNFKGARNRTVQFTDDTFIFGNNATGKTTLFDAFTWLLFGKDSDNRTDFGIKTVDERGNAIPKIDHEVTGVLEIDGKEVTFRRTLKEKWVKKRGFEETHFEGNETIYHVDDVPVSAGQYKAKVSELIDEGIFKLITSPVAFNNLKWQDRRAMLIEMAGGIDQDEIIRSMDSDADDKQWLINLFASEKTVEDHKKQIAAQIKRDKDELAMIPTRIDEAERSKPEVPEGGFGAVRLQLKDKTVELDKVNDKIHDASKAVQSITDEIAKEKQTLYNINTQIEAIENEARKKAKELTTVDTSVLDNLKAGKDKEIRRIQLLTGEIETIELDMTRKREEWAKVNAETIRADQKYCPTL